MSREQGKIIFNCTTEFGLNLVNFFKPYNNFTNNVVRYISLSGTYKDSLLTVTIVTCIPVGIG